jgi:hypothetical protein
VPRRSTYAASALPASTRRRSSSAIAAGWGDARTRGGCAGAENGCYVNQGLCRVYALRSFSINYELNAVIYEEQLAKELEADFDRDLGCCKEFDPAAYQRRGSLVRFRDSVARLLSPLL